MSDIQFIIELTNGCNFACKYCYLAQANALENDYRQMSSETAKNVIDMIINYIYKQGDRIYIDFLDGEPLLNFDVMKTMIEYGKEIEKQLGNQLFFFRFTTNGSLLQQDIINFIKHYNIYFNISIDGSPVTHDKNRVLKNGQGTSQLVFSKLDLLKSVDTFGIVATFMPNTIQYMYEGYLYLVNHNIKHIEINFGMGYVTGYDMEMLLSQYAYILDFILTKYEKNDFSTSYVILDRILEYMFLNDSQPRQCVMPFKVTYDGTIRSCDRIMKKDNKIISTITDKSISFDSLAKAHYCRNNTATRCNICSYRKFCVPCILYTYPIDDNTEPYFCAIMKLLITKAMFFYDKKKNDIRMNMRFNTNIRKKILSKNYAVHLSSF